MTSRRISSSVGILLAPAFLAIAASCVAAAEGGPVLELHPAAGAAPATVPGAPALPPPIPEIHPGVVPGYLPPDAIPDSLALLPPPPAEGSGASAMDQEISKAALAARSAMRWKLAGMDANLSFPWAAGDFACALGAPASLLDTPHLYQMLRRTMADATLSIGAARDRYGRRRPFLVNNAPTCTPGAERQLATDGSYPSAHAAIGWTWALILSEISPDQSQAILARGKAFGQSRIVCNVHWQSDVTEGLFLGAATVARLHADAAFLADLNSAKIELAAMRARKQPPQRDCKVEADALAQQPEQAQ